MESHCLLLLELANMGLLVHASARFDDRQVAGLSLVLRLQMVRRILIIIHILFHASFACGSLG